MTSTSLNERILEVLKDAVSRQTSARGLSDQLGHSHNYVRRIFSGEIPLQMETLQSMLEQVGLQPRLFFEQVLQGLPDLDPAAVLRFYREGDGLPRDPFLDQVESRLERAATREVAQLDVPSRREELDRLEEERFEDRDRAKAKLEAVVVELLDIIDLQDDPVPAEILGDLSVACAIWATIQRVAGYRDNSCDMYIHASQIAERSRIDSVLGILTQKISYLLLDLNCTAIGLQVLKLSSEYFLACGDLLRVGQVQVDKGLLLLQLGELETATAAFTSSLKILPESASKSRAAAHANIAYCLKENGKNSEAIKHLRHARTLYQGGASDIVIAQIIATEAGVALELGLVDEAEKAYLKSMKLFETAGHPGNVALVALDYAQLLLRTGRTDDLSDLADTMFRTLRLLRNNKIIDAILMDFIRTAKWGEVTRRSIEEARRQLHEATAKRPPGN